MPACRGFRQDFVAVLITQGFGQGVGFLGCAFV